MISISLEAGLEVRFLGLSSVLVVWEIESPDLKSVFQGLRRECLVSGSILT